MVPETPLDDDEDHAITMLEAKIKGKKGKQNSKQRKKKTVVIKANSRGQRPTRTRVRDGLDEMGYEVVFGKARNTWNLGKQIGLCVENEGEVIEVLAESFKSKVGEENQIVPKRSGGRKINRNSEESELG